MTMATIPLLGPQPRPSITTVCENDDNILRRYLPEDFDKSLDSASLPREHRKIMLMSYGEEGGCVTY